MTARVARAIVLALAIAVAGVAPVSLSAHPGSTTAITVDISGDAHFVVEIHTNAEGLATKLDVLSGDVDASVVDIRDRLAARTGVLLQHTRLAFDGQVARARITSITVDEKGQAVVRLEGTVPAAARSMTWSTPLVFSAYPFAVRTADATETVEWIHGADQSEPVAIAGNSASGSGQFARGLLSGFTHVIPKGLDHMLFVVGLFLVSRRLRDLLTQVTLFTLAHSVTLGLSLYGAISLPSHVVEPLIAMSVAYVGLEGLLARRVRVWHFVTVFAFGLLHGLGFAGALGSLALSPTHLLSTLASFNIGVELGQLSVLLLAAAVFRVVSYVQQGAWRPMTVRFAAAAIAVIGTVWTIERISLTG